ncbi:MAG: hypothetical protein KBS52_03330 [Clostridiales bacterium]|nr:hypothetical protein [Candidatus Equinaster intestinalis]
MKKFFCIMLALLITAAFAGCKKEEKGDNNTASSSSQTESSASDSSSKQSDSSEVLQNKLFKKGIWGVSLEGKAVALYSFTEDGKNCRHYSADDGSMVDFDYEAVGSNSDYIFHMTTYNSDVEASIVFLDENTAGLIWETLEQEKIVFIADKPLDEYLKSVDINDIVL